MKNKILYLITTLVLCSCVSTHNQSVCANDACLKVTHIVDFVTLKWNGFYLHREKFPIPSNNYVFIRFSELPGYAKEVDGNLIVVGVGWEVVKQEFDESSKFQFLKDFPEEDKLKYGYYTDRRQFYKLIETEYRKFLLEAL